MGGLKCVELRQIITAVLLTAEIGLGDLHGAGISHSNGVFQLRNGFITFIRAELSFQGVHRKAVQDYVI